MLLIAAPGQGAQAPGFLVPWLELPGFADRLAGWSELTGCDLIKAGTTADAEEIRDTAVAQPLLVAAAIAAAQEQLVTGAHPVSRQSVAVAGHSVGELAAGVLAGVITADDAMRLVRIRAQGMAAAADEPTGMTAVLGSDEAAVAFARTEWNYYRLPGPDDFDRPSPVSAHLAWLSEAGFRDVDVVWMYAGHAIITATRAVLPPAQNSHQSDRARAPNTSCGRS